MIQEPKYTGPIPSEAELERMLDRVKQKVFMDTNAAFLGSLLCSHDFQWVDPGHPIYSAATDGKALWWNKADFMRCSPKVERPATLLHELWHTGLMHSLRRGNRDRKIWNIACDHKINLMLIAGGYDIPQNGWWVFDHKYDDCVEEDIYDDLVKNAEKIPVNYQMDLQYSDNITAQTVILANVIQAVQLAEASKAAGNLPSQIRQFLNQFLEPKIDWRVALHKFFTDFIDGGDYTWSRPNRRSPDIYLPSFTGQQEALNGGILYAQDVSGSIGQEEIVRFNSEVKYIKDVLQPEKLTLVQFDSAIQFQKEFQRDEPMEFLERCGNGGTDLEPIRQLIEEMKPTAVVIFSDLYCDEMKPLSLQVPIIWATVNNPTVQVPFGTLIHVTT